MASLQKHIRNTFLAGLFAAIPIAATAFIVWYVNDLTSRLLRIHTPFVALLITLAGVYVLGLLISSMVGRFFVNLIDRMLSRVPVVREVYQAWKHVSVTPGGKEGIYGKVVLIPADGSGRQHAIGFSSGDPIEGDADTVCVFVPMAPNPVSGRILLVARSACRFTSISMEEAFKMILSSGNYVPPEVGAAITRSPAVIPTQSAATAGGLSS